jgi:L-glutamine:2-deoxy-scyllo-inosose/3-amino-2,3-dideoxy-scyllo-inosose aminotransferase
MTMPTSSRLAILGGAPVMHATLQAPAWPPLYERTVERLREIYFSRQWSFNSPTEQEFERAFADYHGAKHGIFMANGTVTLQCALGALGVGPGDEVIVPGLTWMATAMAVHYVGATPVFVDIEPDTLCLDPVQAAAAITSRTKAIIPVHLYGGMANLDAFLELGRQRGVAVIEDCAHMHGGKWRGRGVGSWGAVGSFSFQQSKTVASGEGGICLTNDDALAERLYRQKHIGYGRGMTQGQADAGPPAGLDCFNFRGTAFQAGILLDQVPHLAERIARYERAADRIRTRLADVEGVRIQARGREASPQGYYGFFFIFERGPAANIPRRRLQEALAAEGLPTCATYGPVYRHLLYNLPRQRYRIVGGEACPVADTIGTDRAVGLLHQWLGADDATLDAVGDIVAKVAQNAQSLSP